MSPSVNSNAYFTQTTNQKIASFFSTNANYKSKDYNGILPTHDADKISQLSNHVAEVAVTFDKAYSYNEIQKMIPENLLINWYWIGYNDSKSLDAAGQTKWFGLMSNSNYAENGNNSKLTGKLDNT
uniref:anti sigma factor C-terminal domain-containing protein n=1 Tax=Listeria monocytogenes TaxID=1639 RepID=UPI002905F6F9